MDKKTKDNLLKNCQSVRKEFSERFNKKTSEDLHTRTNILLSFIEKIVKELGKGVDEAP